MYLKQPPEWVTTLFAQNYMQLRFFYLKNLKLPAPDSNREPQPSTQRWSSDQDMQHQYHMDEFDPQHLKPTRTW